MIKLRLQQRVHQAEQVVVEAVNAVARAQAADPPRAAQRAKRLRSEVEHEAPPPFRGPVARRAAEHRHVDDFLRKGTVHPYQLAAA
jgi:hypothetical protein